MVHGVFIACFLAGCDRAAGLVIILLFQGAQAAGVGQALKILGAKQFFFNDALRKFNFHGFMVCHHRDLTIGKNSVGYGYAFNGWVPD